MFSGGREKMHWEQIGQSANFKFQSKKTKFSEAYLRRSQTSLMEPFCENSERLLDVNYFCKNAPP